MSGGYNALLFLDALKEGDDRIIIYDTNKTLQIILPPWNKSLSYLNIMQNLLSKKDDYRICSCDIL